VNFQKDYVALAPNQNLVFRLSLDADKLPNGSYFVQGLVSGFRPGKLMKFDVLNRPQIRSTLNQNCGKAVNKQCELGLKCSFENSKVIHLGVCKAVFEQPVTHISSAKKPTTPGPGVNSRAVDRLGRDQIFENRQILKLENVDYFANDAVTVSEFKKLVFEKSLKKIDLVESNNLLTKQQSIYLLYYFLYSERYPRSLNGLFFLDTVGAKYTDYIDAAASLGVLSMSDKYFYPFDLVTRGEVLRMIDKFLAIKI